MRSTRSGTRLDEPGTTSPNSTRRSRGIQCPSCSNTGTLTLHWNGTRWSVVPSPAPGPKDNVLNAAAAVSPAYAWAVGSFGNSVCTTAATVILHWNGTA